MSIEKITSVQNAGIKRVVRLRTKKGRKAKGLTIVEGAREVGQAIDAGLRIVTLYACFEGVYKASGGLIQKALDYKIKVIETTCAVFDKMAYGDRKEGVLALVEPPEQTLDGLVLSKNPLIFVLERVEKPGNVGAVLRTADAVNADAVIVTDELTDMYNPNIVRASLGAVFSVPTVTCSNEEAYTFFQAKKIVSVAAVVQAKNLYDKEDLTCGCAIVLGSEQDGLAPFWAKHAECQVRIPMLGRVDSLNVSVSAAVMAFEAVRQRKEAGVIEVL